LDAALRCNQAYGRASDAALAILIEHLFVLAAASDAHVGIALLREATLLLRKNQRLHNLLDGEGGLFGLGGVVDRAVTLVWHLQALSSSVAPHIAKASQSLSNAVVSRRASVADLFPLKDARRWLASEVVQHISALSAAPAPQAPQRARSAPLFFSEFELQAVVDCRTSKLCK
jgi:hypothetical protein